MINPSAGVRLQIHKYFGLPVDQSQFPNNGTAQPITGRDPLQGVGFMVYRVAGVDLTTNAGWQAATALSGYQVSQAEIKAQKIVKDGKEYLLETVANSLVVTDAAGTATFDYSSVGLYLVVEVLRTANGTMEYPVTRQPSGESIPSSRLTPAAPFFVTLPLTNPKNQNSWLYDVHVYPKNVADTITKTVVDKGVVSPRAGIYVPSLSWTWSGNDVNAVPRKNDIVYTINASIPGGKTGPEIGKYEITDYERFERLSDVSGSLKIIKATAAGGEEALVAGSDYVFTAVVDQVSGRKSYNWAMTPAGLVKLATAKAVNPAAQVQVTMSAKFDRVAPVSFVSGGQVSNVAYLVPSQAWFDLQPQGPNYNPGILSNSANTFFFAVQVRKVDLQAGAGDPPDLSGAEFKIYWDQTPGDGECLASDLSGGPISTAAVTNKLSDGSPLAKTDARYNQVYFYGLQRPNSYNGVIYPDTDKSKWLSYCVVESKAPAGYELSPKPQYVSDFSLSLHGDTGYYFYAQIEFKNVKAKLGNSLPLTGGAGAAALGIAGVLLIGGGIGYYTITARRRRN